MSSRFDYPMIAQGQDNASAIRSYLYRLSDKLEYVIETIDKRLEALESIPIAEEKEEKKIDLTDIETAIQTMQGEIASLDARVTALEPEPEPDPEEEEEE